MEYYRKGVYSVCDAEMVTKIIYEPCASDNINDRQYGETWLELFKCLCSPFCVLVLLAAMFFGATVTWWVGRTNENERIRRHAVEEESTRRQDTQRIKLLEREVSRHEAQSTKHEKVIDQMRARIDYETVNGYDLKKSLAKLANDAQAKLDHLKSQNSRKDKKIQDLQCQIVGLNSVVSDQTQAARDRSAEIVREISKTRELEKDLAAERKANVDKLESVKTEYRSDLHECQTKCHKQVQRLKQQHQTAWDEREVTTQDLLNQWTAYSEQLKAGYETKIRNEFVDQIENIELNQQKAVAEAMRAVNKTCNERRQHEKKSFKLRIVELETKIKKEAAKTRSEVEEKDEEHRRAQTKLQRFKATHQFIVAQYEQQRSRLLTQIMARKLRSAAREHRELKQTHEKCPSPEDLTTAHKNFQDLTAAHENLKAVHENLKRVHAEFNDKHQNCMTAGAVVVADAHYQELKESYDELVETHRGCPSKEFLEQADNRFRKLSHTCEELDRHSKEEKAAREKLERGEKGHKAEVTSLERRLIDAIAPKNLPAAQQPPKFGDQRGEVAKLKEQLSYVRRAHNKVVTALKAKEDAYKSMDASLFARNPNFAEGCRSFFPELEKLRVDNVTLKDELDHLKAEKAKLEGEVKRLDGACQGLEAAISSNIQAKSKRTGDDVQSSTEGRTKRVQPSED